jgi:UDP-3-O-[3-hydroxymyristoyl] glucosamine N-acyltransferase
MRLGDLAAALDLDVEGDRDVEVRRIANLEDAGPDDLAFVADGRYAQAFEHSHAAAFLLPDSFEAGDRACMRSATPHVDFARVVEVLYPEPGPAPGVHPTAVVADDVRLGKDVSIGAYAVIGERVQIGDRTRIRPHVTVYSDCVIGDDCEIHSGTQLRSRVRMGNRVVIQNCSVIGSDGFGFAFRPDGTRVRIPHRSGVEIGDDVDIGSNTAIDASHPAHPRAADGSAGTRIARGVKIDNHVHVAHGCKIGEATTLCAHIGLAGRTTIGRNVFFAGHGATSGNLHIGDGTAIFGMSGVMGDVEPGSQLVGVPVQPRRTFFRVLAASKRLPELLKRVARLEKKLGLDADD